MIGALRWNILFWFRKHFFGFRKPDEMDRATPHGQLYDIGGLRNPPWNPKHERP